MCTVCMQMRDKRDGLVPCGTTDTVHLLGEPNVCQGMESQHIIDCAFKLCITLPLTPRRNSFIHGSPPCLSELTKHTQHQTNWFLGLKLSLAFDCESMQQFIRLWWWWGGLHFVKQKYHYYYYSFFLEIPSHPFPSYGDNQPTCSEFRTASWETFILKCRIRGTIS